MTGRVFVGPDLNRNEEWLHTSSNFMMDIYIASNALYNYSHFMRPFAARFLVPEIRKVWAHQATAKRLLVPIMEQRQRDAASDSNFKKPNDMIQWLMDNNAKEEHPRSFADLANLHLLVCFSALHTSTLALTHTLYDLAARPEYFEPLREEQQSIQKAAIGMPSKFNYNKMIKMDSFMKESQRLNPPSLSTFKFKTSESETFIFL
jgi:cytochrome P450